VTRLRKRSKRRARQLLDTFDRRHVAHFLHVGKTGGTAIKIALEENQRAMSYRLVPHGHQTRLYRIPEGHKFFFCVRDPVDRYVSAFLSRQREGRPVYTRPWTEEEARSFARFSSPENLAGALSAGGEVQREAEAAMRAIGHVKTSYWDWFLDPVYFRSRAEDIIWIGHQEHLDVDGLAGVLGLDRLDLPKDAAAAHRWIGPKPELSETARQNLKEWYARDYEFLRLCDEVFFARPGSARGPAETERPTSPPSASK
jgi:hypothetical protein